MNFGESLSYWYLRLNGFIPLQNFVLHRHQLTIGQSADADLLAVRFPYVYEEIGGQREDWDNERFNGWGFNLNGEIIGLIVEVKTGRYNRRFIENLHLSFSRQRLLYGIRRLGFWPLNQTEEISDRLFEARSYLNTDRNIRIAKLLITANLPRNGDNIPPCLVLSLDEAVEFIVARMRHYNDPKQEARIFFPSDLMQYLIWSQRE